MPKAPLTPRERAYSLFGGLAAGCFGGLFGVGGGILMVPVLTGPLGVTQHEAHGTSLAAIGATAVAGLAVYAIHGQVDWPTAALAAPSSAIFARLGARTAARMSTRRLQFAFGVLLLVVAVRLLWKAEPGPAPLAVMGIWGRLAFAVALGSAAGYLAGVMGVGGGIIAVPAFTLLLGMTQQQAQGTSLALILLAAPVGAWEHSRRGYVVGRLARWLAVGAVLGAVGASKLVQSAPGPLLTRGFAIFLVLNAVPLLLRSTRTPRTAGAP